VTVRDARTDDMTLPRVDRLR